MFWLPQQPWNCIFKRQFLYISCSKPLFFVKITHWDKIFETFINFTKLFSILSLDIKYFLQTLSSPGRVKMPLEIRHFVETKFWLRKNRSMHPISIISMDRSWIDFCCCGYPACIYLWCEVSKSKHGGACGPGGHCGPASTCVYVVDLVNLVAWRTVNGGRAVGRSHGGQAILLVLLDRYSCSLCVGVDIIIAGRGLIYIFHKAFYLHCIPNSQVYFCFL